MFWLGVVPTLAAGLVLPGIFGAWYVSSVIGGLILLYLFVEASKRTKLQSAAPYEALKIDSSKSETVRGDHSPLLQESLPAVGPAEALELPRSPPPATRGGHRQPHSRQHLHLHDCIWEVG